MIAADQRVRRRLVLIAVAIPIATLAAALLHWGARKNIQATGVTATVEPDTLRPAIATRHSRSVAEDSADPTATGTTTWYLPAVIESPGALDLHAVAGDLGNEDAAVRTRAIETLARATGRHEHLLGQVLFAEPDPQLRLQAVQALAARRTPADRAFLQAALDDSYPEVRDSARALLDAWPAIEPAPGTVLAAVPGSVGLTPDVTHQLTRPQPAERIAAIDQLYGAGPVVAVAALEHLLVHDPSADVREAAVLALAHIGGAEAEQVITRGFGDADPNVRLRALNALAANAANELPALGTVLLGDPDAAVRERALRHIARAGGPAAHALLTSAARDPDEAVRTLATQYLGL